MPTAQLPASGLLGRESECHRLARLVADVRAGQSRVLVVRGEAGVGKTALLEHLAATASECTVVRANGVESEMELAFAGVHALCAPLLEYLPRLPDPQRVALGTAFGLDAGPPPDRFIVGLAVLTLFAEAAEDRPLLCIVDDVQWLDRVSAQTLTFVGRRLLAERVGLVLGARTGTDDRNDLPTLDLAGLAPTYARALLDSTIHGPLDTQVRRRILAEADGNPLGLLELPRGMSPAGIAGGFGVPEAVSLVGRIEHGFAQQLRSLPEHTRRLLLLAAAEPVGDVSLLRRAMTRLGLEPGDAVPAEESNLIHLGLQVRFRHPLVRSAAYRAADVSERAAVHLALAEVTDPAQDPDRRAWHRALATARFDEAVAAELEQSAERARNRGGIAGAAAFLARAAQLTPDAGRRGERALAAAKAMFDCGTLDTASEFLALAAACPLDALQRARLTRLRAEIAFAQTRGRDASPLLLNAASGLEPLDPDAARETYLEALDAALIAGDPDLRRVAEVARRAPAATSARRSLDLLLDGMATRFTEGPETGVPALRIAVQAFTNEPLDDHAAAMAWLSLCPAVLAMSVFELWDDEAFHVLPTRAVRLARDAGALTILPTALAYLAGTQMFSGDFSASTASVEESDAIRVATGHVVVGGLGLVAWKAGADAPAQINAAAAEALARGEARVGAMAGCCTAILNNGLAHYGQAAEAATRGSADENQWYTGWSLVELVEAATRAGQTEVAASALRRLERRTQAAGTDWALGVLARSRALMSDGSVGDALYREAIERLDRTRIRIEALRARLVYGEWLRREQRRVEAREHLRLAYDQLNEIGAEAYAERARRELALTGESVPRRTAETRDALTPQEAQIARMARDGQSNPEIAAQLFISARTVEYHLRKVFSKLDISGRRELKHALGG